MIALVRALASTRSFGQPCFPKPRTEECDPRHRRWTAIMDANGGFIGKVMRAFAGTGERAVC
jgi:hypothetical protein